MKKIAVIGAVLEEPNKVQQEFNDVVASFKGIVRGRMGIPFERGRNSRDLADSDRRPGSDKQPHWEAWKNRTRVGKSGDIKARYFRRLRLFSNITGVAVHAKPEMEREICS